MVTKSKLQNTSASKHNLADESVARDQQQNPALSRYYQTSAANHSMGTSLQTTAPSQDLSHIKAQSAKN